MSEETIDDLKSSSKKKKTKKKKKKKKKLIQLTMDEISEESNTAQEFNDAEDLED